MYAKAYAENPNMPVTEENYKELYEYAKKLQKTSKFKWNKIFIFPPSKKFVNDGIRYLGQESMKERQSNFEILQKLINEFYPEVSKTYLNGSFLENYNAVKDYINGVIEA
jgi:nicotinamide riboside kinase